ncbi:MAG: 4Fe-4S binding protein [Desulfobacterota bacterium]|nr:4Fe-4S binding protein [Thermodesulfobacteriota bacterium]
MKEKIKAFLLGLGVDDVGIASVRDYRSPRSPDIQSIFPGVRSIVVLAHKALSNCESGNMQIAMGGRLDEIEFARSTNYRLARFLEKELKAKAMTVPPSYPLYMSDETKGTIGDVSLRHAAIAAGLGHLGRHNLVIHPRLGSRVLFTAVLTNLDLPSDPPVTETLCTGCHLCVTSCPVGALDEEGKTDDMKCLKNSQPYGIGSAIRFWTKFAESPIEDQKRMIKDVHFWRLYQAGFIGFQYFCFNCFKSCPVGQNGET